MSALKKLREVIKLQSGGTPSKKVERYWNGHIPWATVKDFTSTRLSTTQDHITKEGLRESSSRLVPAGHVIIPTRMSLGKAAINTVDLAINQDLRALVPLVPMDTAYLLHAVLSLKDEIVRNGSGATVKGITQNALYDLDIYFPPIDEQRKITAVLGKVERLIAQRKQHLAWLDDLLKSVFLDMFGGLIRNEKGWEQKKLVELCASPNDIKCGPFGTQLRKSEFREAGVPIWGIPQVNSEFVKPPTDFVTEEKAADLREYSVIHSDIVMSRKGSVGSCSLFPSHLTGGVLHSDVLRIRGDWTKTNPIYLCTQLQLSRYVEHQIANVSRGAIMAGVNVGRLKSISVFAPPFTLQEQFAGAAERIDQIRKQYKRILDDLEILYAALSQSAFKGELDLSRVRLPLIIEAEPAVTKTTAELGRIQISGAEQAALPTHAELTNASGRAVTLRRWLDAGLGFEDGAGFDAGRMLDAAQERLAAAFPDEDDIALTVDDYETIKRWAFEQLRKGRLAQTLDEATDTIKVTEARG